MIRIVRAQAELHICRAWRLIEKVNQTLQIYDALSRKAVSSAARVEF